MTFMRFMYCIIKKTTMKKILMTEIHMPPADIQNGSALNTPKDRILLDWLIKWVEEGLQNNLFNVGDLIPSKKDLAKFQDRKSVV